MLSLASTGNARAREPHVDCSQHSRGVLLKSTTDSIVDSSTNHRNIEHLVFSFKHKCPALGHDMYDKRPGLTKLRPFCPHTHAHTYIDTFTLATAHAMLRRPQKHHFSNDNLVIDSANSSQPFHSINKCHKPSFYNRRPATWTHSVT